jgi:3-deoxy-D-manno-octulosonate 8-phosphate phosphatase (KDO 8-P phosphatase)
MTAPAGNKPWPPRSDQEYRQEVQTALGADLAARFGGIKLMVFDADGVLTAGHLVYGPHGEALKEFHAHDGLGLVMARMAGIKRAVLTGRNSTIVDRRAKELRFESIKLGRFDKVAALREILSETGCSAEATLYVGDDLIDVPAMYEVGLPIAVPAAPSEVQNACLHTTVAAGGSGAVREVTDLVLKAAGLYGLALSRLSDEAWRPTTQELSSDAPAGNPETGSEE